MTERFAPEIILTGSPNSIDKGREEYPEPVSEGIRNGSVVKIIRISSTLTVLVSGIALFSDGYSAQIIGYMEPLFSDLYPNSISSTIKTRLSSSYLIGEIFGMLAFGLIIDKLGRRTGIVLATCFLIFGIIIAAAAHGEFQLSTFWMMMVGCAIAGFGAGGEYPAFDESAYVRERRGILVAMSTGFAIDFGFVVAGVVALIILACYHQRISEGVWKVAFGLGIVLPLTVFFFRIRMINSTQYRKHAIKQNIPYVLALRGYWKPMLGTSLAWFCYDFVTYPFGIFSSTIIAQFNPNNTLTENIGYGLPGCIVGGLPMDRIGRKQIITLGFFLWGLLGFILGGVLGPIQTIFPLFVVLYGIFNALGEIGPGVATFLTASESFPMPLRGHYIGFAATVCKAGAAIGTQVFTPIQKSLGDGLRGQQGVFLTGSAFAIVGGVIAWAFIPDMERELESEDIKFRRYLEENCFDTSELRGGSLVEQAKKTAFTLD